jgi:integrase
MIAPTELARLQFREAAPIWLTSRRGQIGPRTLTDYGNWIKILGRFFDNLRLDEIHIGHIQTYQQERLQPGGPTCVNHEIGVLNQILKRAGVFDKIEPHYCPVKVPQSTRGCVLDSTEEEKLFRVASSRPRWKIAYCCALITAHTSAGPGEIRNLRMRDIVLSGDYPHMRVVEGAKNQHRVRDIPLNASAIWAIQELVKRAKELGAIEPGHFLLPHRAHKGYKDGKEPDPTRPAGGWRKAWENLREAAGMPTLRLYDLRHHVITRLLEDENVSERTVIEIAGHVSRQMLNRYSHIRMRTKKEALDGLMRKGPESIALTGGKLELVKR